MSERLDRIEALLAETIAADKERAERFEQGLEETRQIVQSNSRSIEALSAEVRAVSGTIEALGRKIDLYVTLRNQDLAAGNDERQAVITRISRVQRTVDKIADHLGVDENVN